MSGAKPFDMDNRLVWQAYEKVKANKGSAGIDGVTLEKFEEDREDNLYKGVLSNVVDETKSRILKNTIMRPPQHHR